MLRANYARPRYDHRSRQSRADCGACPVVRRRRKPLWPCLPQRQADARDVLACDLANVNMVLHAPGALLGAAWVEATRGDFTFYVQGMTPASRAYAVALDEERRAVARAFGHDCRHSLRRCRRSARSNRPSRDFDDSSRRSPRAKPTAGSRRRIRWRHRYYQKISATVSCHSPFWPRSRISPGAARRITAAGCPDAIGRRPLPSRPHRGADGHCGIRIGTAY